MTDRAYGKTRRCGRMAAMAEAQDGGKVRILDWVESQSRVTRIWLDELIAEGDPNDFATLIHKQATWLDLMRERLRGH